LLIVSYTFSIIYQLGELSLYQLYLVYIFYFPCWAYIISAFQYLLRTFYSRSLDCWSLYHKGAFYQTKLTICPTYNVLCVRAKVKSRIYDNSKILLWSGVAQMDDNQGSKLDSMKRYDIPGLPWLAKCILPLVLVKNSYRYDFYKYTPIRKNSVVKIYLTNVVQGCWNFISFMRLTSCFCVEFIRSDPDIQYPDPVWDVAPNYPDVAINYPDPDPVGKTHPAHPYAKDDGYCEKKCW